MPIAFGWHHTVVSRQFVLEAARDGKGSRVEAKFMYPEDLPPVQLFADQRAAPGDGYWVVAASSVVLGYGCTGGPCIPPPVWSMVVVTDDTTTAIASQEIGNVGEQRWPAVFDRLADRAAPEWWPLVPPGVVAVPAAVLSLLLGIVVWVRARRQGRTT